MPKPGQIEPMTIGNMRALGVRNLDAYCSAIAATMPARWPAMPSPTHSPCHPSRGASSALAADLARPQSAPTGGKCGRQHGQRLRRARAQHRKPRQGCMKPCNHRGYLPAPPRARKSGVSTISSDPAPLEPPTAALVPGRPCQPRGEGRVNFGQNGGRMHACHG